MFTEIYIEALLVDGKMADQVWGLGYGACSVNYQFRGIVSRRTVWRKLLPKRAQDVNLRTCLRKDHLS